VLETGEGVVARLRGVAGVLEAGALEASLSGLVARRPACVTVDLSELQFISSLAMGALVTYRRAAARAGTRVRLAPDLRPDVREALTRAELLSLLDAADSAQPCPPPGPSAEGARKGYPNVQDVQRIHGVTWGQLVEREPQLDSLLRQARTAGAGCRTLKDVDGAFGPLRNELAELIGFKGRHHGHRVLGGPGAYQVAYWKLYDAVAGLLPARAAGAEEAPCGDAVFVDGLGI
jgi:anti-anti-sigma regulatory factor